MLQDRGSPFEMGRFTCCPTFHKTVEYRERKEQTTQLEGDSEDEVDCQAAYPCGTSNRGLPTGYQVSDCNKTKSGHINMSIFKTSYLIPPLSQPTPCHCTTLATPPPRHPTIHTTKEVALDRDRMVQTMG